MEFYETVAREVNVEQEIQRSRFLTRLVRVETEAQAREIIAEQRALHPKSRHTCTAFVLGADGRVQRSNDDGEPSGTAGAPMLEALVAAGLSDVVAVVTRYFGGILLGAGGLTRAYRGAVAQATLEAERVRRVLLTPVTVASDYSLAPVLESEARRRGWTIGEKIYNSDVSQEIMVSTVDVTAVKAMVLELTSGSCLTEVGESRYVDFTEDIRPETGSGRL